MHQPTLNATRLVPTTGDRPAEGLLRRLASLRLTLVLLGFLALGILVAYGTEAGQTWPLVPPLSMLAVNLLAAVITNPAFRRKTPLLAFHLCLVVILVLVAVGRLTALRGRLELAEGAEFQGMLTAQEAGPLHWGDLSQVRFRNEGFAIDYAPGRQRGPTANQVAWTDPDGRPRTAIIGDQTPLTLRGYRFYTSFNKGFAPVFTWLPTGGPPVAGTVHLPAFPAHEYRQAREWTPPGAAHPVWIMLQFDEVLIDPARPDQFRLPKRYELVVRQGDLRQVAQVGESVPVAGGHLRFEGLTTWMGYTVFYDWTLPWLLATCAVAVASLAWHFAQRFAAHPWDA